MRGAIAIALVLAAAAAIAALAPGGGELPAPAGESDPRGSVAPAATGPEPLAAGDGASPTGEVATARVASAILRDDGRRIPAGDRERVRQRAKALATRIGLSEVQREELLVVLLEEQSRRAAALRDLRTADDRANARSRSRAELADVLAWKVRELEKRFGPELAAALMRR